MPRLLLPLRLLRPLGAVACGGDDGRGDTVDSAASEAHDAAGAPA